MYKNGAEKCPGILVPKLKKKRVKPRKYSKGVWVLQQKFLHYVVF